ncbi:hypothetical protein C8R47DRAFT_1207396 [Mycena vitilis]|nr:hypothetical protein C8R47DRAFT_1207396 [Mycena vitilis]
MSTRVEVYDATQFPSDTLLRTSTNLEPPLYQFGILLRDMTLIDYAAKHELVSAEKLLKSPIYQLSAIAMALQRLRALAKAPLSYRRASDEFGDEYSVLSLYSNYNLDNRQLVDEDEQDVIRIIKEELDIDGSPRWYWDRMNDAPDADPPSLY